MALSDDLPFSTPVSVITGFLGSGKTTLLSRLLADPRMNKAAVIINEFGEVGLDHVLVTAPREDMVLLSSGCLCCSLRGDLVNTLTSLFNERARGEIPAFDRVLVETTGLADPAPVLLTVSADERLSEVFHIERVIATADAAHGLSQLESQPESVKQACVADVLLITKTDVADPDMLKALRTRLERLNPIALKYDVVQGKIDPDVLFNFADPGAPRARDFGGLADMMGDANGPNHHHDHNNNDESHTHAGIRTFSVVRDEPVTVSGLEVWMGLLRDVKGPSLLRIKGIVNIDGRPIVIQAVQHMFHPPSELPEWPDDDRRSRIVFITRDVERADIERTLDALSLDITASMDMPASGQGRAINPDAFRQFVAAASKFR